MDEEELFVVVYRKFGATEWELTRNIGTDEDALIADAQARFYRNCTYNKGRGYEYAVMQLVPVYLVNIETKDSIGDPTAP